MNLVPSQPSICSIYRPNQPLYHTHSLSLSLHTFRADLEEFLVSLRARTTISLTSSAILPSLQCPSCLISLLVSICSSSLSPSSMAAWSLWGSTIFFLFDSLYPQGTASEATLVALLSAQAKKRKQLGYTDPTTSRSSFISYTSGWIEGLETRREGWDVWWSARVGAGADGKWDEEGRKRLLVEETGHFLYCTCGGNVCMGLWKTEVSWRVVGVVKKGWVCESNT